MFIRSSVLLLVYCKISVKKNPSNEGFGFLKLLKFKQWKLLELGETLKVKMAQNEKKWHVKTLASTSCHF